MKTKLIVKSLLELSLTEAMNTFKNQSVKFGTVKNPDMPVTMSLKPIAIGGGDFDVKNLNSGTDIYLPARIGSMYVRLSALSIGKNNGGVTYTISVRTEDDQSTIVETGMTNDFGVAHDIFIETIRGEL